MTTRNYLFAADDASSATTALIATAARVTGFMKGATGGLRPGWYGPGTDNSAVLAGLDQRLAATYPAAGPAFRAVRLYTNFLWQPVYLAVIAVHIHARLPELAGVSQRVEGIYADGYRLITGPQQSGSVEQLIDLAGAYLGGFATDLLAEVNALEKLRALPARRLLADRLLSVLLRLNHWQPELGNEQLMDYADRWLAALGLSGQGRLQLVAAPDGRDVPIIARKGCCLDYLIEPKVYCASCPKQETGLRLARQTANAVAELG